MNKENKTELLYIKNMVCQCSMVLLSEKFTELGFFVKDITLGRAKLVHPENEIKLEKVEAMLQKYGFDLTQNREEKIIEKIKIAVIELIHHLNNSDSIVRKSDYIVEKLGLSYQYISKVFSEHENRTLEKYIILQKIERVKHLIDEEDMTLSEISYLMDYSSVQHLSKQFKLITGMTISQYKDSDRTSKLPIDRL